MSLEADTDLIVADAFLGFMRDGVTDPTEIGKLLIKRFPDADPERMGLIVRKTLELLESKK